MGNYDNGYGRRFVFSFLTTMFLTASVADPAAAHFARRSLEDMPEDDVDDATCAHNLTRQNLQNSTGYSNFEDALLASAYTTFMRQIGQDPSALHAILNASDETGVDFELMVAKAMIESHLGKYDKPIAVNGSARGMFQFMPATWLTLFAWFGDEYNDGEYKELADAIQFDSNGNAYVVDKEVKQQILDLRSDHYVASYIKAMQIREEETPVLRAMLGREPKPVDYYMVHFLGIPRAETFYANLQDNPDRNAVPTFRREARYNRSIFYQNGKPRSFQEVYDRLDGIIQNRIDDFHEITREILYRTPCVPVLHKDKPVPSEPPRRLPGFAIPRPV